MINRIVVITATKTTPTAAAIHGLRNAVAWTFSTNPCGSSPPGAKRQASLSNPRRKTERSNGKVANGMMAVAKPKTPRETLHFSLAQTKSVTMP